MSIKFLAVGTKEILLQLKISSCFFTRELAVIGDHLQVSTEKAGRKQVLSVYLRRDSVHKLQ